MTDTEYLLSELEKGPRDAMQVISASIRDRGVGLTVHSRVADLRAQGYTITCSVEGETRKGRPRWVYRLCGTTPSNTGEVPFPSRPTTDSSGNGAGVRATQTSTPTPQPLEQMELIA